MSAAERDLGDEMIGNSRTFRVFVSSTFTDLVEKRNALQSRVFSEVVKLDDHPPNP